MVERAEGMAFAAGAWFFQAAGSTQGDRAIGEAEHEAGAVAAIRETIEETAVPVGLRPLPDREAALEIQGELVADSRLRRPNSRGAWSSISRR